MNAFATMDDIAVADSPETAYLRLRPSCASFEGAPNSSASTMSLYNDLVGPAIVVWMPFLARTCAPVVSNAIGVVREFRSLNTTLALTSVPRTGVQEVDDWAFVPETVTKAEVDELRRIWALPYPGDVDFDFGRAD